MRFDVITLFPESFGALRVSQIWKRAEESGAIQFHVHDLREFAPGRHRVVDDVPYGGGPGMVLKVEPLVKALESIERLPGCKVLFASPQGRRWSQSWAEECSLGSQVILISGRYEGVDERFVEGWVDECFSIGDYVLSGGELPAMVFLETVARLLPGVVGDFESVAKDSFTSGMLKFPQYTRPPVFRGMEVPEVLRSGNHAQIERWREAQAKKRTLERRPELFKRKSGKELDGLRPNQGVKP